MTLSLALNAPSATDQVWTVGQLNASVKRLLENHASKPFWVRGEILQCRVWSTGNWYFTLRDKKSQVRCYMSALKATSAGKPPADGTEVYVLGKPGFYEEKGDFQLLVSRILPTSAVGVQQQELERVKALLQAPREPLTLHPNTHGCEGRSV
jgi:exodeoxyribonuclease VII large subunit